MPRLASSQSWIERGATGTIQPYVRAISAGVGQRHALERQHAVRKQDRRPFPAAAAEVRGEGRARLERRAADDVQEREARRRGRAADLHELAIGRSTTARQPAAAEVEPAWKPVDGAEVHERTAPRRLAEHRHAERRLSENRLHGAARDPVELEERQARLRGHAAPHRLDRAVGRLELCKRALHRAVLHRGASDRGHGEHRRADGDAEGDEHGVRRVQAHPQQRVANRHEHALSRGALAAPAATSGCRLRWA